MEAIGMGVKKGQGATEYLVLLAVVLIIALVAIALLGFFPGLAGEARITQSDAYWRGVARPFSIVAHSQAGGNDSIILVLSSSESEKLTITDIELDGVGNITGDVVFTGGETKTITVSDITECGASGFGYEYTNVTITYSSQYIAGQKEFGAKPLIGKCT
jgi:uncharacterized protein (UPF0333 family)